MDEEKEKKEGIQPGGVPGVDPRGQIYTYVK